MRILLLPLQAGGLELELVTAAPEANGFFGSKGVSGRCGGNERPSFALSVVCRALLGALVATSLLQQWCVLAALRILHLMA